MKRTITILLAWVLTSLAVEHVATAAPGKRPNILFIIADDQSPLDLKVYNPKSQLQTPNIDRLAARRHGFRRGVSHGRVCRAASARRRGT